MVTENSLPHPTEQDPSEDPLKEHLFSQFNETNTVKRDRQIQGHMEGSSGYRLDQTPVEQQINLCGE